MNGGEKTILVADDDRAIRFVLEQALSRAGFNVLSFTGCQELLDVAIAGRGHLVITDIIMPSGSGLDLLQTLRVHRPDLPVIVITAQSTLRNAVQAFERGAFEYLAKPFDIKQLVELVGRALEAGARPAPPRRSADMDRFGGFVGVSPAMQDLFRTIGRLSHSEMTVLIHGESGTGKELVARAVHKHSPRRQGPLTAINMAAIPRDLIESELFGHEKGAFTGAVGRRIGHFERARGGTLFLDEIGDMPMEAQTRLLRVLQNGSFTRVGGTETLKSDVRIIAATHQDLPDAITAGRFREDLFYRLNVVPLHVPSLRSRREDVPLLADFFLAKVARDMGTAPKRFSPAAMRRLQAHQWPGNVRELENLVRRLMVLAPHELIEADHLDLPALPVPTPQPAAKDDEPVTGVDTGSGLEAEIIKTVEGHLAAADRSEGRLYDLVIRQVERALLLRTLRETHGNRVRAAAVLGINRNTLRKKLQVLDIDSPR